MEKIAKAIARWMRDTGELTEDQEEIVVYVLVYVLLSLFSSAGVLVLSWGLGVLWPGVLSAVAAASLRLMSGGEHYSSANRCALMSGVTFPVLAWLVTRFPNESSVPLAVFAVAFGVLAVLFYAPVDNEAKPIRVSQRRFFRIASLMVVALWAIVLGYTRAPDISLGISSGLVWQSLSLTPVGRALYNGLDRLLMTRRSLA